MLTTSKWIYEDLDRGFSSFSAMAFDGRFFYFTDTRNIYVYSKNLVPLNCINPAIKITAFCYDNSDNCFWATDGKTGISKLTRRFEKAGQSLSCGNINGLSYFCAHDTLLASTSSAVVEICKHDHKREIHTASNVIGIASIAPFFALLQNSNGGQFVHFYNASSLHATLEVPPRYTAADIMFYPPDNQILVLAQSRNQIMILRHPMPCIDVCNCNYSFDSACNEHCQWLLANTSCNSGWKTGLM